MALAGLIPALVPDCFVFPQTACDFIVMNDLSPNTSYTIRVWALEGDFSLYGPFSLVARTSSATSLPSVTNVFLERQQVVDNSSYSALIRWIPEENGTYYF